MDNNTNINKNNENLIPKLNLPGVFYPIIGVLIFMIIMLFLILSNVNLGSLFNVPKSSNQTVGNVFIILFFSLIIFTLCFIFLPNLKEFKQLFEQISNTTYVILFTIFFILFYTMVPKDIVNSYHYIINPLMLGLGALSFYKGASDDYIEKFNINYERIKMIILLFCLITIIITFYNINPGGSSEKYFGYSLLLTIIIAVFGFLYLILIMTLPGEEGMKKNKFTL